MSEIDYQDITDFKAALERFPSQVDREVGGALRSSTELIRGEVATYPGATSANAPPGNNGYNWYERGFGTRTVTGRVYPTSEMLGRSWTTRVIGNGPWEGRVGTTASYAPYVQDEERQAGVHKGRWITIQDAIENKRKQIVGLLRDGIRRAIALVKRG